MSVKPSHTIACAVADAALTSPVYHVLPHLVATRFVLEQDVQRANHVQDTPYAHYVPTRERKAELTLEGLSDGSDAEGIVTAALLNGVPCLLRVDMPQGERLEGNFYVLRLQRDTTAERFERLRIDLRSDGAITLG